MMLAARALLKYIAIATILPVSARSLTFDPAIDRRRQRSFVLAKADTGTSKCPLAFMTTWFRKPTAIEDFTDVSNGIRVQFSETYTPTMDTILPPLDGSRTISWKNRYTMLTERAYGDALALKCPFFRRRATDILELTDSTMRRVIGKNVASLGPAVALRGIENVGQKMVGLSIEEISEIIRKDWREGTNKGYYVTGRLTTNVYRDDCLFDGPDPDMPVRGIRKYMNAASQLFEYKSSTSKLLSLNINEDGTMTAKWRFNGTMRLPWKPKLPEVTGTTTYHIDSSGLIYEHIETWDISALNAFFKTFFPKISNIIWPTIPQLESQ